MRARLMGTNAPGPWYHPG